ncbi:MAG: filamentous hemagglutinin N-terminal domain-containing protein [Methylobacillus sp.]|jgi:filamentous hemagglutinin family protein|nr:filamentous hemagglutinin N-terminal domain-containing protein [Methylobacillus sp.]
MTASSNSSGGRGTLKALPLALLLASPMAFAADLPTGGQVIGGSAAIGQSGNTMTITQSTDRAAINWNSFSIGSNSTVNFVQPNANSITLNRVVGNEASVINGALNANGQVWIQNANGVLFGGGSVINVNGLLATTHNVDADQFMSGNLMNLAGAGNNANIINNGNINAQGYVVFSADRVQNNGDINAGKVILAAGDSATVSLNNGQGISVELTKGSANALVENTGNINAGANGEVLITAQGANTVLNTIVNLEGVIQAGTVNADAKNGNMTVSGIIDVSDDVVGAGFKPALADDETTWAGLKPAPTQDGGTIILKAMDGIFTLASTATLDASSQTGNGGFIETSGAHVRIADGATITTQSANGNSGIWLIDPVDFTIAASGGDMTGAQLSTALASNNVTIQSAAGTKGGTAGDVNVNDEVSWNSTSTLTLDAYHSVNIKAAVTTNGGTVTIITNDTTGTGVSGSGSGDLDFGLTGAGFTGSISFNPAGSATDALNINGANYTLVYSVGDMNTQMNANSGGNYALAHSVDASGTTYGTAVVNSLSSTGRFEGLGNTISHLTINSNNLDDVGLFGISSGAISNIGLTDVAVTGSNTGYDIGGLVGYQTGGTITHAYVTGTVSSVDNSSIAVGGMVGEQDGGLISNAYANVAVSGGSNSLNGGLVGFQYGSISNVYATGTVSGSGNNNLGGLVGELGSGGSITNAYATGAVNGGSDSSIGGLVGRLNSSSSNVSNVYATGAVSGSNSSIGGLVGYQGGGGITNAFFDTDTTGQANGVGFGSQSGVSGLTTAQLKALDPATGLGDSAGTIWANNGNYPCLVTFANCGSSTNPNSSGTGGSGGSSGGGGGGGSGLGAGIAAVALVGGAIIYNHESGYKSDEPQALTEENGETVSDATLDTVNVNAEGTEAVVKVRVGESVTEHRLSLKDQGDGVMHFAANDGAARVELSFNPNTHEYFYRANGLQGHGWLKAMEVASR